MSGDKKQDADLEEQIEYTERRDYKSYVPTTDELDDDNPPSDDSDDSGSE